jgi:serine/threonine protein kinase
MICASCQEVLPEEAEFCGSCGASTKSDPRNAETLKLIATTNSQLPQNTDSHNSPSNDPRLGLILDSKYHLLERLGSGGMGSVYRARRLHIGDDVAVKLLSHDLVRDRTAIERFRREARSAAMIRHSNVVTIYDFNDAQDKNNEPYIVMELVRGDSLRKLLQREVRLSPERAVSLMRDVCAGVGVAHRQGLLHRDLKPDNVIVTSSSHVGERETAKVVDFGLAKVRDAAHVSALTQTGTLLGTLYYMSPEQCRGEEIDPRADVYSLGAMLYEMLTGHPPFVANNPVGLIAKHLNEAPAAFPADLSIPTPLAQACFRALAKNPEERQADAISLGDDLQAALALGHKPEVSSEKAVVAAQPGLLVRQAHQSSSALRWVIAGVAVSVLVVALIGFGLALRFGFFGITGNLQPNQNRQQETASVPTPTQTTTESDIASSAVSASDLRGRWTGSYGPLGQPATLMINSHKGNALDGVLEQGTTQVAFSGTVSSGSVHLKQTKVIKGSGWDLGEDIGTVSRDGKKMSGTGKDAVGESMGITYEWSFTRD